MSKRTKSFFEQSSKPAHRNSYKRTHTTNSIAGNVNQFERPNAISRPPIIPSTDTKNKLKNFQFLEGRPSAEEHDAEKENAVLLKQQDKAAKPVNAVATPAKTTAKPPTAFAQAPPPSTPATRLPLAVLVGNSDDRTRTILATEIPEEEIYWQHNANARNDLTPAVRRSKKRARSSSPATSSQQDKSTFFDSKQPQHPVTKAVQPDPATDLWNRYGGLQTPASKSNAAFAHLISDPSPRSDASTGSVGGLRRWASCGEQWPTSNSKRRKVTGNFRANPDKASQLQASTDVGAEKPTSTKAARLLERIQATMVEEPRVNKTGLPSSSSPLPGTGGLVDSHAESPLRHRKARGSQDRHPVNEETSEDTVVNGSIARASQDSEGSSDYGDIDLDTDMLQSTSAKDKSTPPPPLQQEVVKALEDRISSQTLLSPSSPRRVKAATSSEKALPKAGRQDEFGLDDDDDMFDDDDLVDLAATCEDQPTKSGQPVQRKPSDEAMVPKVVPPVPSRAINISDDEDDFGGSDIDEEQFAAAEKFATQQPRTTGSTQASAASEIIDPLLILDIQESSYVSEKGHSLPQKILRVRSERRPRPVSIILRQSWMDSDCQPGTHAHVVGYANEDGDYIVDDMNNLLILHPDQLLSATTVSESSECLRRSVLNDRVKVAFTKNPGLVYGSILHELFQEAIKTNRWDEEWLATCAAEILPRHLESIIEIGVSIDHALDHLRSKGPALRAWAQVFMQQTPGPQAIAKGRNGSKVPLSISKLLDVEENIFSPMYGLKGKVDATVQIRTEDKAGPLTLTVPFELKTGKENASHQAQTALYTLLLSDRYDVDIAYGLLWNIETSNISRVEAIRHLIRPLIMRRNELASWIRQRSTLPPVPKNYAFCDTCKVRDPCFVYQQLVEGDDGSSMRPKAKAKFDELVKYLKPIHATFFSKWQTLLSKEETDMMKFRKELWTMLSKERERLGRCFSQVVIEPGSYCELHEGSRMNRFRYTFLKHKSSSGFSFAESQLVMGEPVVVSDEIGHYYLAKGFVTGVTRSKLTITVDRALHNARVKKPGFDEQRNQVFAGITELPDPTTGTAEETASPIIFRLDKDEFENGMGVPRNNLIQLMNDGVYKASELRSMIVDGKSPTFKPTPTAYSLPSQHESLNEDQTGAIEKVMSAQDYALVLGMPGTGKTTTIAQIIRALVARGKSVLLTSFQHSAVDNILLKIRNDKFGILRLGAVSKVHPDVRNFAILAEEQKSSIEEIERSWTDPPIVAATCLKVDHPIFSRRVFDYCIVDEASQITLPVCLGPIRMAKTFVLVGDHYQLPPLVRDKEALSGGLDQSLFRILSEQHPEAVTSLSHQYRMNEDIMTIANTLIYSGRLKCGSPEVASRHLKLPSIKTALGRTHFSSLSTQAGPEEQQPLICTTPTPTKCPIARTLFPTTRVAYFNTDALLPTSLELSSSSSSATRITNPFEATLLTHLTSALLTAGVPGSDIGIITPHRSQLSLLKTRIRTIGHAGASEIELNTADKYQGRDKEVILVSFVRSNESADVGELLRDARRVNVAVTRARSKLVLVGSRKTLENDPLLKQMIDLCDDRKWTMDLAPGCIEGHCFEEAPTQITAAAATQAAASPRKQQPVRVMPKVQPRTALGSIKASALNSRMSGSQTSQGKMNANGKLNKPFHLSRPTMRQPEKGRVQGGLQDFLDKRPVLRDLVNDAA